VLLQEVVEQLKVLQCNKAVLVSGRRERRERREREKNGERRSIEGMSTSKRREQGKVREK